MIIATAQQQLKDVLMDPKSPGVKEPYFQISGEGGQNLTVVTPGKNGDEFNKTYGYFYTYLDVLIYHVAYGQGVLVMQRNDAEGEAKEFKIVTLRPGVTIEIPVGYGHCLVNIGKTYLITIDSAVDTTKTAYTVPITEKKGFAYFIVDKRGEVGFASNPSYKIHPQISTY